MSWKKETELFHGENFGLKLPKMVKEAAAIDKKNRNILWLDAI